MLENNTNQELERAVRENNLKEVKALLAKGAEPNFQPKYKSFHECGNRLLHYAKSEDIAKELLSNGAWVDARNEFRETPLHTAIPYGRTAKLVRELLKHGAEVNATDRKGNTPLNLAVKKNEINLDVIAELLYYGADINKRNRERRIFDNSNSPLDNARFKPKRAKLLIKITVLKHFDKGNRNIELDPYKKDACYQELSIYKENCVSEITKMKTDIIDRNISLHELLFTRETNKEVLYLNEGAKDIKNLIFQVVASSCYPIYCDVIISKASEILGRASLLKKMSELKVYTKLGASNHSDAIQEKTVHLDPDSMHGVAQYLSDIDLLSLIAAFYKHADQPSCLKRNFSESSPQPTLNEVSPNNYAKCAKLE